MFIANANVLCYGSGSWRHYMLILDKYCKHKDCLNVYPPPPSSPNEIEKKEERGGGGGGGG